MYITSSTINGMTTLTLSGRLDAETIASFKEALQPLSTNQLILDMRGCNFVSSIGIREILKAHRDLSRTGGSIALVRK